MPLITLKEFKDFEAEQQNIHGFLHQFHRIIHQAKCQSVPKTKYGQLDNRKEPGKKGKDWT
jgi:hypothetical protein